MEIFNRRGHWRNEMHVVNSLVGHHADIDCWCEPKGTWTRNKHGVLVFVVEHNDTSPAHHHNIITTRNIAPDPDTKLLNSIYMFEHER
jgi:hypothetical protein